MGVTIKGRGTADNPPNRFDSHHREACDDGWGEPEVPLPRTELIRDSSRSVLQRNEFPDVSFDQSVNPYRGCEHGCIYCFARPSHAFLGHSPGLDFETRIHYKPEAPELLRAALARPGYRCRPIALGTNTEAWQPSERRLGITRRLLDVLHEARQPVSIVTKSALIERDLDLLSAMAREGWRRCAYFSPPWTRSCAGAWNRVPRRRLRSIARLCEAGVPVGVLVALLIPFLTGR